jgi:hypothetical protein
MSDLLWAKRMSEHGPVWSSQGGYSYNLYAISRTMGRREMAKGCWRVALTGHAVHFSEDLDLLIDKCQEAEDAVEAKIRTAAEEFIAKTASWKSVDLVLDDFLQMIKDFAEDELDLHRDCE